MNEGIGSKCENTVKQLYFMLGQLRILRSSGYLKRQLALDATPTAFIIAIVDSAKTFPEKWDSKAPSAGTLLAYLETMA